MNNVPGDNSLVNNVGGGELDLGHNVKGDTPQYDTVVGVNSFPP